MDLAHASCGKQNVDTTKNFDGMSYRSFDVRLTCRHARDKRRVISSGSYLLGQGRKLLLASAREHHLRSGLGKPLDGNRPKATRCPRNQGYLAGDREKRPGFGYLIHCDPLSY